MIDKAFELTIKALDGEELTDDEKLYLQKRNAKYELIRYIYMEKMDHEGVGLKDFQFTPGDKFVETPIIDILNDFMEIYEKTKRGEYKPLDFGDLRIKKANI